MNDPMAGMADAPIERLIVALDSLQDGELAVTMLVACGNRAVPYLEHFLLAGSPRTIALPRCRAVQALGGLGAYTTLVSYFCQYEPPCDAQFLFAEDAVRSAVARELLHWKSDEAFRVLFAAAGQRATCGLILALGEFRRSESVPLLFAVLEDDLCRNEAKDAFRKVSAAARHYAILTIRGLTANSLNGPSALRRRRATLQLLGEFGVYKEEWQDIRWFLEDQDADVVIAAANIGSRIAPDSDQLYLLQSLFRISCHLNWVQEDEATKLLDSRRELARQTARMIVNERRARGERPNWLAPSWRVLWHVLGRDLEGCHYGAA
jgi:hypothetical protein